MASLRSVAAVGADFIGLDVCRAILDVVHAGFDDPTFPYG